MKNFRTLLASMILIPFFSFGQRTAVSTISSDQLEKPPLFSSGTSIVDLLPNVSFSWMKNDNSSPVKTNTTNINIRGNYYPWDLRDKLGGGNLGIVGGIHYRNVATITESPNAKNATGFFMFEAGAQYGTYLNKLPLRAELTAGIGNYRPASGEVATAFALNFNVATFIELGESDAYFMPYIGFGFESNRFKDPYFNQEKTSVNGLIVGASLVRPMGCGETYCGFHNDEKPLFEKGTNISQFLQNGILGTGASKTLFASNSEDLKGNVTGYDVQLSHYYYPIDNLGVGAGLKINGSNINNEYVQTKKFDFTFMPMVRYHVPVESPAINSIYVDAGVGFGVSNTSNQWKPANPTETNNSLFNWEVGAGYNWPFSDHFSVVGEFHYVNSTSTNKENNDAKVKNTGTKMTFGLAYNWGGYQ